jgi:NhaA family Na+:H+ antiporter
MAARRSDLAAFFRSEAAGGVALLLATLAALAWANAGARGYHSFWGRELNLGIGDVRVDLSLDGWVNDALMAVFFFVVGLEIKRELAIGELRDRRTAALPVVAAAGGMVIPAVLFVAIAHGTPGADGWAIPVATDIAFVLGALALLGSRIPPALKLFLLALAIADDIGGILIIAVVYSDDLSAGYLLAAIAGLGVVLALRRAGIDRVLAYAAVGVVVWYLTFRSGVHATIAGVALGLLTPAGAINGRRVLHRLERGLHPVSAFVIVPLFALANAGVELTDGRLGDALDSRLAWAVVLGLVAGKPIGIAGASWIGVRLGIGRLPDGVGWPMLLGGAALAGIGFTVALFIAQLSFDDPALLAQSKVAILLASTLAAVAGSAFLTAASKRPP